MAPFPPYLNGAAIHKAAFDGDNSAIRGLCKNRHTNINAVTSTRGLTPLHFAIEYANKISTLELLIELGADINQPSWDHQYPLTLAAATGNLTAVQVLLAAGARIEIPPEENRSEQPSAMASAGHHKHFEVVRALLDAGADVDNVYAMCYSPDATHPEPIEEVATALIFAVKRANTAFVKMLLEAGADTEWVYDEGSLTALKTAVVCGNTECVQLLLDAGANLGKGFGESVWEIVKRCGHADVEQLLVEHAEKVGREGLEMNTMREPMVFGGKG